MVGPRGPLDAEAVRSFSKGRILAAAADGEHVRNEVLGIRCPVLGVPTLALRHDPQCHIAKFHRISEPSSE